MINLAPSVPPINYPVLIPKGKIIKKKTNDIRPVTIIYPKTETEHTSIIRQLLNEKTYIDILIEKMEPYIKARNRILNNPIKYALPCFRKKLKEIDTELDKIELEVYQLQTQSLKIPTKEQLNSIVVTATLEVDQLLKKR